MSRFINQWQKSPALGEANNLASETIPNQALSVTEILKRWRSGLPLEGIRQPQYSEEEDIDFKRMDIEELHAYGRNLKDVYNEYEQLNKQDEEAERKRKQEEAFEKEVQKRLENRIKGENRETPEN